MFSGIEIFNFFVSDHLKGHFPLGGIFRAERHFLLFKDKLAESGRQKKKENIIPRGKFRLVENGLKLPIIVHRFRSWNKLFVAIA